MKRNKYQNTDEYICKIYKAVKTYGGTLNDVSKLTGLSRHIISIRLFKLGLREIPKYKKTGVDTSKLLRKEIKQAYTLNITLKSTAESLNISSSTLVKLLRKHKIPQRMIKPQTKRTKRRYPLDKILTKYGL